MVRKIGIYKKGWAIYLSLLFCIAITPSGIFHNLFAHHADDTIVHRHLHNEEIAQSGINCNWNHLVCEGSFLNEINTLVTATVVVYNSFNAFSFVLKQEKVILKVTSRGPPAI